MIGFCGFLPSSWYAATFGETQEFIVTAYYSPLPDQQSYARWSYEADKKLNWNWIRGASNTPVFTGMIAAPSSYEFGTHIFFEGLGVGRVEDRGGAIVDAWVRGQPHDRIDIWMGYGDAGLKRARAWWVRQVTGVFIPPEQANNFNTIDLDGIDKGRVNLASFPTTKAQSQWGISADVIEAFAELGYMVQNADVKDMIFRFQVDQGILSSLSDDGAGNFWPKTKAAFAAEYKKYTYLKRQDIEAIEKAKQELLDEHAAWDKAEANVNAFGSPVRWETGDHVQKLQTFLRSSGYMKAKVTGTMNPATILALKSLQKKNGISPTGKIDTRTKDILVETILQKKLI